MNKRDTLDDYPLGRTDKIKRESRDKTAENKTDPFDTVRVRS